MLRPMTPGTLAALAEDNSRDYLRRLTREQRNCAQLHQQHLHLQARILCELYDIADSAFEAAQIRQILEQRQAREDDGFTRLEQANASLDNQLALFRQAQERLVASHSRALAEQRQHPALRQGQQQLQQARQKREQIAADHQPLVDECTGKLAAYSQDALRWLRYELKTDSLNQALAQWAAIGSPQATRFQQELDELRRRLDSASQRVGQAREVYEQACTFESALGRRLRGDAGCASDCNCNCHTQPSLDDCPCQLRYPLADQYRDDTNYGQLIVGYMNRAQTLNTVLGTISALRLLPGNPDTTLSDRPLMQGQP